MSDSISIAIISDLHCRHSENKSLTDTQTFLTTDLDIKPTNRHPIEALKLRIKEDAIAADILLCPGDISDKMDKQGLFSGWKYIQEIKESLKSKFLFATTGNHDVDSRKKHEHPHPNSLIKQLEDNGYPTNNIVSNEKYWSEGFCIIIENNFCILNFNSCYSHVDQENAQKCIIEQVILDKMRRELSNVPNLDQKFKICLLHHHPDHHSNFDLKFKDGDFVQNGDKLLELTEDFSFNIVVHGHKHEPKLRYVYKLPVFASGSFSSMMNTIDIKADNTFHLIKLETKRKGTITSWAYGPTKGWTQEEGAYFPCNTGFGAQKHVHDIAQSCYNYYKHSQKSFVSYADVVKMEEDIKYLIPTEQKQLVSTLLNEFGLKIYPSVFTKPEILIKPYL